MQKQIKKGAFSAEDDKIILEHVKRHGTKNWSGLTQILDRCRGQIRQRYSVIKTFLAENPTADVKDIPMRRYKLASTETQFNFLTYMADQWAQGPVPTISQIEESLQVETKTVLPTITHLPRLPPKQKAAVAVKNIDALLTNFFNSSVDMGRKYRIVSNFDELTQTVLDAFSILKVDIEIPEDFELDPNLDDVDFEILNRLRDSDVDGNKNKITRLVPPNIGSIVGLRSLIIKHKDYKTALKNKPSTSKSPDINWAMEQNLLKLSQEEKNDILFHRNLFSVRFHSLFNWSATLSLERPTFALKETVIPTSQIPVSDKVTVVPTKSTFLPSKTRLTPISREDVPTIKPKCYAPQLKSGEPLVKKRKIDLATLKQLTPRVDTRLVNENFVNNLMKTSTKTVKIVNVSGQSVINDSCKLVEINDTSNLNRRNEKCLKTESAVDDSENSVDDDYEMFENDTQLLNEIDQYDSSFVKNIGGS